MYTIQLCIMKSWDESEELKIFRANLVDSLKKKGISDERVLEAIGAVPRQLFMKEDLSDMAYVDKAFPITQGQTISQPYTVAYQTQLLEVRKTDRVLEIGTGSGYQAVILALMADEVFTIERQRKLFEKNQSFEYMRSFPN